ncbi:penicillin acylase family protein, partial [Brevirhabdus pacifica]
PSRAASGASLLANDPHNRLTAPTQWYLARLELESGGVIGATMPGMPQVMAGRSDRLGWGITSAFADDLDLFVERLDPANSRRYETEEGFVPFRTESAVIRVKDAAPVTITLRWTRNGPVLPGNHFDLNSVTPPGHVIALSWTGLSDRDTTIAGFRALMKSRTTGQALKAGERFVAPAWNLVLADRRGIAMQTVGALPERSDEQQGEGRLPTPGRLASSPWRGTLPYADNPGFSDPEGGIVGNTNNRMVDRPFPRNVSGNWGDMLRIQRWRRLMQSRGVHTRESFIEAQLDTVSNAARTVLPLIARNLWFTGTAPAQGTPERKRQTALELLANWNGEMNEHLPEPLIYAAWARNLQHLLIRDELGEVADRLARVDPVFIERVFRDIEGAGVWCDVVQSAVVETCTDISRAALDTAIVELEETHGAGLESLRWGDAHLAEHRHPILGDIPLLSWFVNIRQSTSGGDHTLQRGLTAATGKMPYANIQAAGYRGVYDFADPDSSVFVTATGQSGHPLSRFYDNLGDLWRRGEYTPMSLDIGLAAAAAVGHTVLLPAAQPR